MANIPPAAGPPPGGPQPGGPGLQPVNPGELHEALHRLGNLPASFQALHARNGAFRAALGAGLQAIEQRIAAITNVMPNLVGARADLEALQHQIVANTPNDQAVQQLQDVIDNLAHDQLQNELAALQQAVIALETSVGVPPLTQPPATDPFAQVGAYAGGYKNTSRARTARAKRLRTRKNLHSHKHARRQRRKSHKYKKHAQKKRAHKKRIHHRRR